MAKTFEGKPAENHACLTDLLTRYTLGLVWNEWLVLSLVGVLNAISWQTPSQDSL